MTDQTKQVEVTFVVPQGRTVTHRGELVKDGQKIKVDAHKAKRLAARGLIRESGKGAPDAKSDDKSDDKKG